MATAETARLVASLELQDKNFTRGLRNVERGVGRVDKKLSAVGGFVNRNLSRAIDSLAIRGVEALGGTIEQASNLNEEIGKSDAVFGSSSAAIKEWADTTAVSLGIAEVDALAAAGTFGNLFKTIGTSEPKAAKMSKRLVELAADMASFNNEDPSVMLEKLRSGLSGEAEPLRAVGVFLSEAAVKEEAYSSGIAKRGKKLTEAQKVQARYNLILKQTAVQQGDVEKTGGNLAGQQRKLDAMLKDISATIGTELLPVVTELTSEFVNLLKDPGTQAGIKSFAKDLGAGAKGMVKLLKGIDWGAIVGLLKEAAGFAGQLVTWFSQMPGWAQAFLVGGFVATKLPIVGDLLSGLASGLIKGVLGINAGIVNVNGPVAGAGGAGGAAGGASKLMKAVRILGAVTIAGASLIALAEVFKGFQTTVTESQEELGRQVEETSTQGFKETIANLQATNKLIRGMNPLESVLAGIFGGSEIVKNFEMATDRIRTAFEKGELTRDEMVTAIAALDETFRTNPEVKIPAAETLLKELIAEVNKGPKPRANRESKPLDKVDPLTMVGPLVKTGSEQKQELGLIKNGLANLNTNTTTQTTATTAALSGVKTGVAAMDANQKAAIVAQTAVNVAGNVSAAFQAAGQLLATGTTTQAVNTGASATRGVAPPIVSTLLGVQSAITTAIWGARPVIQSTNVVNNYTQQQRTGASSGSRQAGWDPTH